VWLKVRGQVACNFVDFANDIAGKSNERELIQTYTESEAASLFLWSVLVCTQWLYPRLSPMNIVAFYGDSYWKQVQ
jgi:hypothetical protein